ncbi:hypothetical protein Q1695_014758 [Nippostrongylus brasiliensis]|nr:hypothetical protein Q1695_014758 [Nippostrongylus brasiliensis]
MRTAGVDVTPYRPISITQKDVRVYPVLIILKCLFFSARYRALCRHRSHLVCLGSSTNLARWISIFDYIAWNPVYFVLLEILAQAQQGNFDYKQEWFPRQKEMSLIDSVIAIAS